MIGQLIRYFIAGSVAAIAHFIALIASVEVYGIQPTLASSLGFCVAVFFNYSLQYHWTFAVRGPHGVIFSRYLLVTIAMFVVNTGGFWLLHEQMGLPYPLSQVLATAAVVMMNFQINRLFTFNCR